MTFRILNDVSKVNQFPFVQVWSNNVLSYISLKLWVYRIAFGIEFDLKWIFFHAIWGWHFDWFKTENRIHHRFYAASTAEAFGINSMEFQWYALRFIWRTQHDRLYLWKRHESEKLLNNTKVFEMAKIMFAVRCSWKPNRLSTIWKIDASQHALNRSKPFQLKTEWFAIDYPCISKVNIFNEFCKTLRIA